MQSERAEEATEAARKLHEELKKQMNMTSLKLSLDEEENEGKCKEFFSRAIV